MIATHTVETGPETLMANNIGIQQGGPEKNEDDGISIGTFTPSQISGCPANEKLAGLAGVTSETTASPMLPSYPVGWGISLPFGQLLPKCELCGCRALIARTHNSGSSEKSGVRCLTHGLTETSVAPCLVLKEKTKKARFTFISQAHEDAIRAFFGS